MQWLIIKQTVYAQLNSFKGVKHLQNKFSVKTEKNNTALFFNITRHIYIFLINLD